MFEIAVILGLLIGFFRGGSLAHLAKYDFVLYYLVIGAFVLQLLINPLNKIWPSQVVAYLLLTSSYLMLLSAMWLNRKNEFLFIILIGLLLNFIVIAVNAGMPVSFEAAKSLGADKTEYVTVLANDFKHVPLVAATKLKILADIIPLPKPYPFPAIYSIGDIFISMGIMFFLQHHMRYNPRHLPSKRQEILNTKS